mmetsp:Transcript_7583/g.12387  ORF Transcript_7583/g.12387 Transcript_7583/m.12387 type:complete len:206 (+) Transcript_7583:721-1338(+)
MKGTIRSATSSFPVARASPICGLRPSFSIATISSTDPMLPVTPTASCSSLLAAATASRSANVFDFESTVSARDSNSTKTSDTCAEIFFISFVSTSAPSLEKRATNRFLYFPVMSHASLASHVDAGRTIFVTPESRKVSASSSVATPSSLTFTPEQMIALTASQLSVSWSSTTIAISPNKPKYFDLSTASSPTDFVTSPVFVFFFL